MVRSHNQGRRPSARAISSIEAVPMIWDKFFYFLNKLRHRLWHTRVYAGRIFADVAQGKWRPKFPKSFMLLANNSIRLCLLEIFRLVCKNGIALAYYGSCGFLVMGSWSQSFTFALIDQTSTGGFDDMYRPFNLVPRAFSLFFWLGGGVRGKGLWHRLVT